MALEGSTLRQRRGKEAKHTREEAAARADDARAPREPAKSAHGTVGVQHWPDVLSGPPAHYIYVLLLVAASSLVYVNGINGEFCFDDHLAITGNADCDHTTDWHNVWRNDFWGQDITKLDSHKSYRPLTVLSFRLNHMISAFEPWSYHVGNIVLHTVVTVQLYFLAVRLYAHTTVAFASALLFAVHPIHTEAVTGIVGRAEMLCCVFVLLAITCYARAAHETYTHWGWLAAAMGSYVVAVLCKETGYTVLGILVAYDVLVVPARARMLMLRRAAWAPFTVRVVTLLVFGALYLYARKLITVHFTVLNYRHLENPIAFSEGLTRALSLAFLHAKYAQLLVYPLTMSADYSFDCLPLVEAWSDPRNLWTAALWLTLALIIVRGVWHLEGGRRVLFALALAVLPFLPASNLFFWVGTMVGERLLYMPSLGFALLLGHALFYGVRRRSRAGKAVAVVVLVAAVVLYGQRTWERNYDWADEEVLFMQALEVCGDSAKVHQNTGILYRRYQDWDKAIAHFERAREIEPPYCDVDHWLGLTYINAGNIELGIEYLTKGIDCKYTAVNSVTALHTIYSEVLKADPGNIRVLTTWADVLRKIDREAEAVAYYRDAGVQSWQAEDHLQALRWFLRAHALTVELGTPDCLIEFWCGRTLMDLEREDDAVPYLHAAMEPACNETSIAALDALVGVYHKHITDDPNNATVQANWGTILKKINRTEEGEQHLQAAGVMFLMEGKVEEALTCLRQVKRTPENCELDLWKGRVYMRKGNTQTGVRLLKRALDCPISRAHAVQDLAAYYNGELEKTGAENADPDLMEDWARVLEQTGAAHDASLIYRGAGLARHERGDHPGKALECFQNALALNREACELHLWIGRVYLEMRAFSSAIDSIREGALTCDLARSAAVSMLRQLYTALAETCNLGPERTVERMEMERVRHILEDELGERVDAIPVADGDHSFGDFLGKGEQHHVLSIEDFADG